MKKVQTKKRCILDTTSQVDRLFERGSGGERRGAGLQQASGLKKSSGGPVRYQKNAERGGFQKLLDGVERYLGQAQGEV